MFNYKNCSLDSLNVGDKVVTDWWVYDKLKKYNGLVAVVIKKGSNYTHIRYDDGYEFEDVPNYELRKIIEREVSIGEIKSLF